MSATNRSFGHVDIQSIYRNIYSGIHQLQEIILNKNQENVLLDLEFQTRKLETITNKLNLQDLNTYNANGLSITAEYEFQIQEKDRKILDLQFTNTALQDKLSILLKELSEKNSPIVESKPVKKGILANFQNTKPPKGLVKSKTVDGILDPQPAKLTSQVPKNIVKKKNSKFHLSPRDCGPALQDDLENPQPRPKSPRPIDRKGGKYLDLNYKPDQESLTKSLPLDSPC